LRDEHRPLTLTDLTLLSVPILACAYAHAQSSGSYLIDSVPSMMIETVLYVDESLLAAHAVLVQMTQRRLRLSAGEADGGLRPLSLI